MAVHSKKVLSGTTNGKPLRVLGATTSGGVLVHTAVSATGANQADEVWLWAFNTETSPATITVSFGGSATGERFTQSVPGNSRLTQIIPGLILNAGLELRCHASASNTISAVGYVNSVVT